MDLLAGLVSLALGLEAVEVEEREVGEVVEGQGLPVARAILDLVAEAGPVQGTRSDDVQAALDVHLGAAPLPGAGHLAGLLVHLVVPLDVPGVTVRADDTVGLVDERGVGRQAVDEVGTALGPTRGGDPGRRAEGGLDPRDHVPVVGIDDDEAARRVRGRQEQRRGPGPAPSPLPDVVLGDLGGRLAGVLAEADEGRLVDVARDDVPAEVTPEEGDLEEGLLLHLLAQDGDLLLQPGGHLATIETATQVRLLVRAEVVAVLLLEAAGDEPEGELAVGDVLVHGLVLLG